MWVELPAAEACAADVGSATSQGCEQLTVEARFLADEVEGVGGHRALFRGSVRGGVGKHGHLHDGPCQLRRPVQRGHRQRHSVDREQVFTPPGRRPQCGRDGRIGGRRSSSCVPG